MSAQGPPKTAQAKLLLVSVCYTICKPYLMPFNIGKCYQCTVSATDCIHASTLVKHKAKSTLSHSGASGETSAAQPGGRPKFSGVSQHDLSTCVCCFTTMCPLTVVGLRVWRHIVQVASWQVLLHQSWGVRLLDKAVVEDAVVIAPDAGRVGVLQLHTARRDDRAALSERELSYELSWVSGAVRAGMQHAWK